MYVQYAYVFRKHRQKKQTKKTTLLAHKYFCEQDVGNDKHSSCLLNRSARQCVVRSACAHLCVCVCVCVEAVEVGVRGHKHRASPVSVGRLVSVALSGFLFLPPSVCVFPPRCYLTGSRRDPGSDTPG